jgi:uncharacterized membrane protein (UPF0127 family)
MLFIDARGRIVKIFERTVPQSLDTLSAPKPVKAVLELRAASPPRHPCRRPGAACGVHRFRA